jgi:hypothetical protein
VADLLALRRLELGPLLQLLAQLLLSGPLCRASAGG